MTVSVLAPGGRAGGEPSGTPRARTARRSPSDRVVRRRASRRRRWIIGICAGLVVAALGTGAWWLTWRSTFLAVNAVQVQGVSGKERQLVLGAAALAQGTPMIEVPGALMESRVESLGWVRNAVVRLQWPRTVLLEVESRQALAQDAGSGLAVDADGTPFQPAGPVPKGLPVIRATDIGRTEAMRALAGLPADLRGRISVVSASTRDDIRFSLGSGAVVRWGSAEQGQLKAQVLDALLSRRALVYDVSAPLAPTTRGERRGRGRQSP